MKGYKVKNWLTLWKHPLPSYPNLRVGTYYHEAGIVDVKSYDDSLEFDVVYAGKRYEYGKFTTKPLSDHQIKRRAKAFVEKVIKQVSKEGRERVRKLIETYEKEHGDFPVVTPEQINEQMQKYFEEVIHKHFIEKQ